MRKKTKICNILKKFVSYSYSIKIHLPPLKNTITLSGLLNTWTQSNFCVVFFFDISNFLLKFWHIFNLCPLTIESRQLLIKTSIQTLFVRPAKSLLGSNCESLAINDALWDRTNAVSTLRR